MLQWIKIFLFNYLAHMKPFIYSLFFLTASNVVSWTTCPYLQRHDFLMIQSSSLISQHHNMRLCGRKRSYLYPSNLYAQNGDDDLRGNDVDNDPTSIPPLSQEELQSFLDEMSGKQKVTSSTDDDDNSWVKTEQDFKVYADLLREMETTGEDGIYSNILGDLNSSSSSNIRDHVVIPPAVADADSLLIDEDGTVDESLISASVLDDADGIGETLFGKIENDDTYAEDNVDSFSGSEQMMKQALQEALIEVRKNAPLDPASDPKSILNDKEMMKELNAIFERANAQLLASISEIREEQENLSKSTAAGRSSSIEAEERRLAEAEESVSRLVTKVRQETQEVEKAVFNLKDAQEKMSSDPLIQAAGLKRAGILKQAAFIGAMLFTFRSLGDFGSMISSIGSPSDGIQASHGYAAAIQGIIAVLCAAYFKFF